MKRHTERAESTSNLCVEKMPAKGKENMKDVMEEGRVGVETLCAPLCIAALSPSSHCLPAPSSCDERQSTLHHHLRERWLEMEEGGRTSR
ncbi:hypothetical protein AMELA_G00080010 [Ameiurus melas]|uniref:Uncharacterized protein n=1 Tax=Ameiurus melas TaxID=219545 RepID=A0A7J6AZB7_AMEME|nr:hypothetical protein AMELA_G00080010 [Ameiurus melas]